MTLHDEIAALEQTIAERPNAGETLWREWEQLAKLQAARADAAEAEGVRLRSAVAMRPEVLAFAWLMERELRANDHKPGWKHDSQRQLLNRLHQEVRELHNEILQPAWSMPNYQRVPKEAADVANFAMMIADNAGGLDMAWAAAALAAGIPVRPMEGRISASLEESEATAASAALDVVQGAKAWRATIERPIPDGFGFGDLHLRFALIRKIDDLIALEGP
jgi:NTP pyrophosphatase (non-canonical NTP hydrolase)